MGDHELPFSGFTFAGSPRQDEGVEIYMPMAYSHPMHTVVETPMYLRAAEAIFNETDRE